MRSRTLTASLAALALSTAALTAAGSGAAFSDSGNKASDLIEAPLAGSLTTDKPIFDTPPGGAPWDLARGEVRVDARGHVRLRMEGLLIPGVGVGPVATVAASLYCNGERVSTTPAVPLSKDGDARIRSRFMVPSRCIAPVVMVNPNGNTAVFIAITGAQR
jgi:hypothetical protein